MTPELTILYRDETIIAVDKPRGMMVHAGRKPVEREFVVMKVLKDQIQQFVYTVHRLDRPTSGILLFALDSEVGKHLHRAFAEHRVDKQYGALVRGHPTESWSENRPLQKPGEETWRESETHFHRTRMWPAGSLPSWPDECFSLVDAHPVSGRHHQIRQHLALSGHAIIGDYLYGDTDLNNGFEMETGEGRLMLHASHLGLDHPVSGQRLEITSPLPEAFTVLSQPGNWKPRPPHEPTT